MNDDDAIEKDGTIYVAGKKKIHLIMGLLLIVAGMLMLIGISSLSTILALLQSYLMGFLSSLTGWDPILANIFIGVMCLFTAVLIYVAVRRESEIAQKIEAAARLSITNEPTEYYALEMIPHEELLNEFRKRGCTLIKGEGKGVKIDCSDMPHSRRVMGVLEPTPFTYSRMEKFAVISVVLVLWAVYVGTLLYEVLFDEWIWIAAIAIMAISALLLLQVRVLRLWHTIILWSGVNIVLSLFLFVDDTVTIWSLWGAEAVYIILVAIAYMLYRQQCEVADKWYCKVM